MNKKSLIQIIVLVLLLVVGGGAYFVMTSEDGIDGLLALVGLGASPQATMPASPAKPGIKRREKKTDAPLAAPAIPAHPAKGTHQGKDFKVAEAVIDSGALVLKPDGGAFTLRVVLTGEERWALPAGKKFKLVKASGDKAPRIELMANGKREEFRNGYTLLLEFGPYKDGSLDGKIYLALPPAAKASVGGTFKATVSGFHIIDGKPDLNADSLDTLEYLTLREILKAGPDQQLKDAVLRDMRLNTESGVPSGYLEASYVLGDSDPVTRRFQFSKSKDGWTILRELRLNQLDEAHPVKKPSLKDKPENVLPYLTAVRLEKDLNTRHKKKGIFIAEYKTLYNLKKKVGQCEVTYRLEGNDKSLTTAYLFALRGRGWALTRKLGDKERLNASNGRIEKKK